MRLEVARKLSWREKAPARSVKGLEFATALPELVDLPKHEVRHRHLRDGAVEGEHALGAEVVLDVVGRPQDFAAEFQLMPAADPGGGVGQLHVVIVLIIEPTRAQP